MPASSYSASPRCLARSRTHLATASPRRPGRVLPRAARETGGALGLIEATVPPGGGPVAHAHLSGGEAFYLVSGELEFLNGDRTFVAGQGDFVYIPPGTRHRYKNIGVHSAKMIFLFTPGGLEEVFVRGGNEPRPGEPAPAWGPEKFGPLQAVAEELGLQAEILPEP